MSHSPRFVRRGPPAWAKLTSATVIANLAGFLVAIWVARIVRNIPESESTETWLRFGYYAAMFVVASIDALLVDELGFRGQFRRALFGGPPRATHPDHDLEETVATSRGTKGFVALFLAALGLTYLLFNLVNHNFDGYYRKVGKHVAAIRRGDDAERVAAIRALAERSWHEHPQIFPTLVEALEGEDETAVWAAWALGRATDDLTRRHAAATLRTRMEATSAPVRREVLIALGRLQLRSVAPQLQTEVRAQMHSDAPADPPFDVRLLYALGSVQVMSSVPVLAEVLHSGAEKAQRVTAWALAQHRDQRDGHTVARPLQERLATVSPAVQCAIVESLGIIGAESSNLALMDFYDRLEPAETTTPCEPLVLGLAPDGSGSDVGTLLGPAQTLGIKVLVAMGRMRASTPEIRSRVEPWLERVIADANSDPEVQAGAQSLLTGIREARDDSKRGAQ